MIANLGTLFTLSIEKMQFTNNTRDFLLISNKFIRQMHNTTFTLHNAIYNIASVLRLGKGFIFFLRNNIIVYLLFTALP